MMVLRTSSLFCIFLIKLLYDGEKRIVVVFALPELAVDEHHEFYIAVEAEFLVGLTVDVVTEDIAKPFLPHVDAREHDIIAVERCLELQGHTCHDGVDMFLFMQLGIADT